MLRQLAVLLAPVAILAAASSCVQDAAGAGGAAASNGAATAVEAKPPVPPPPVLAEAANPGVPVIVQVIEARRATADTVRIVIAFTSKATEPTPARPLPLFAVLADAGHAGAEPDPADFYLVTADGARRLFLLRDAQNKPVLDGNLDPLRPGERRVLQATFPAPPAKADRVTLHLGQLVLRNLPISQ